MVHTTRKMVRFFIRQFFQFPVWQLNQVRAEYNENRMVREMALYTCSKYDMMIFRC